MKKPKPFFARFGLAIVVTVGLLFPVVIYGTKGSLESNVNKVEDWLPPGHQETADYDWYRQHFESEAFIIASWEGCTLDDPRLPILAGALVPAAGATSPGDPPRYFSRARTGKEILDELTSPPSHVSEQQAFQRLEGLLIGADRRQTCILLDLSPLGEQHLGKAIDQVFDSAEHAANIPRADLRLGGPPVDNVAIDRAGERSLFRLVVMSGVIGLCISWGCLRSVRLTLMVFFTAVFSAGMSLAINWFSGGMMNAILLTMPSLVYVAAISGAIHLTNYYRDSIAEGGLAGAPERAVKHAWLPLSLATGTTAVGLASLATSDLVPIRGFGVYSAIGVIASLGMLFLFLPACFQLWPLPDIQVQRTELHRAAETATRGQRRWRLAGRSVVHHNVLTTLGCLAVMAFCGFGFMHIRTSVQLLRLFSKDAQIIQDYAWLEQHLGPLVPMEVILRVDNNTCKLNFLERLEMVQRVQERVEAMGDIGNCMSAVTFAPPLDLMESKNRSPGVLRIFERTAFKDRLRRDGFSKKLEAHRQEFVDGGYLSTSGNEELWRISARVEALKDIDYGLFVPQIRGVVEPVLEEQFGPGSPGISVTYTGLVPLVYKAQRSLLEGLLIGLIMDLALIAVAMMVAMRDWAAGILLLIPSVFPVVLIFGLMGWLGIIVDIGTVMAPSVALGVTVDDVAHFLLWFKRGAALGLTRRQSIMLAYRGCARAMYQSWGVIGLGLAVFAMSDFSPTEKFGWLMVTLLTAALVANLLLLPALLASPLGAAFYKRLAARRPLHLPPPSNDDVLSPQLITSAIE